MTSAEILLAELRRQGFRLTPDGDRIMVAPASKLTDELRALIRAHKPELIRVLAATPAAPPLSADLDRRMRAMARRWQYSDEELDAALVRARYDPAGWMRAVELDEQREAEVAADPSTDCRNLSKLSRA